MVAHFDGDESLLLSFFDDLYLISMDHMPLESTFTFHNRLFCFIYSNPHLYDYNFLHQNGMASSYAVRCYNDWRHG